MPRGYSIHVGVNDPTGGCCSSRVLTHSEDAAVGMCRIAEAERFHTIRPLIGGAATVGAFRGAMREAVSLLGKDDLLFVSFSGHGCRRRDLDGDEPDGDETWCLANGSILDDELAAFWRACAPGLRILVVAESCFSGGSTEVPTGELVRMRMRDEAALVSRKAAADGGVAPLRPAPALPPRPCTPDRSSADPQGISATLLVLSASAQSQTALDGVFTTALRNVWEAHRPGSYCELFRLVKKRVGLVSGRRTMIRMLGVDRPGFPLEQPFQI